MEERMRFLTGCFCCANPRKVLVLQRVTAKTKTAVLFAFLYEGGTGAAGKEAEGIGAAGSNILQFMKEWFYEEALPVCAKARAVRCVDTVKKKFCKRIAALNGEFAALFAVEEECFYVWRGSVEMHLLNLCFNRLHRKRLTYLTEEIRVVRAQIQKGVGLLLGTADFFAHLPEQLLKECLAVDTLGSSVQIERHLREAAEAAKRDGAGEPATILVVVKEQDDAGMPVSCIELLAAHGYMVKEWIGGGEFGQVYRVWDTDNERMLACKVAWGGQAQSILRQETMLQRRITHPLFARYADYLEGQECTMLLMEYVEGERLDKQLQKAPLSQKQAVTVAMQLADGIGYLHRLEEPILYRDLKPEHICLTKEGRVRLMDLGCACEISRAGLTKAGSPGYAPVEQMGELGMRGQGEISKCQGVAPKKQGAAPGFYSDVYALGKLLHYMLTGDNPCKPPYQKPPIRTYNQKFSPLLEQVIMQCVERKPELRIQDMQCLIQRLKPFVR